MRRSTSGFTIVELLIVIVVIAILAAIGVVAYNGTQNRAREATADASLTQIARKLSLYKVAHDSYPDSLDTIAIQGGDDIVFDYSSAGGGYCLSATAGGITRSVSAISQTPTSGDCEIALSKWQYAGGVTYDGTNDQIHMNLSQNGTATSPLVATEGRGRARLSVETYATVPSLYRDPNSGLLFRSNYYASDKVTPAANPQGYTGNGNGTCISSLMTWSTCNFTVNTGEDVSWVKFTIGPSGATGYSSDNILRNVQITILD